MLNLYLANFFQNHCSIDLHRFLCQVIQMGFHRLGMTSCYESPFGLVIYESIQLMLDVKFFASFASHLFFVWDYKGSLSCDEAVKVEVSFMLGVNKSLLSYIVFSLGGVSSSLPGKGNVCLICTLCNAFAEASTPRPISGRQLVLPPYRMQALMPFISIL